MAGLDALVQRLEHLASASVKARILAPVRDALHAECIEGFRAQRDPYGIAWAPRKDKRGTWPLLQKTGTGLDSLTARVLGDSVVMRIRGYFLFHQHGTQRMPARMVFPDPASGLGTWSRPLELAAMGAVRELAAGKAA